MNFLSHIYQNTLTGHRAFAALVCLMFVLSLNGRLVAYAIAADGYEKFHGYVTETIPSHLVQLPKDAPSFDTWQSANKASYTAFQADDVNSALVSAGAAFQLYREQSDDFRSEIYLALLDNFTDMFMREKAPQHAAASIISGISFLWTRDPSDTKGIVNFALAYGKIIDANANHPAALQDAKYSKFFWNKISDAANDIFGAESEQALLSKYYRISNERRYKARHFIKRPLSKLIDEGVAAQEVEPAMMALSLWTAIKMYANDHDDALDRIREVFQTFPPETIPDFYSYRMFQTIAAYHFPKYGPEKTEEVMKGIVGLKSPPRKLGDNDSVGVVPLQRVEPRFFGIRKEEFVVYEFTVSADGTPTDIRILQSTLSEKNDIAGRVAIEQWKYIPPFVDGKFVRAECVRVQFTVTPPS